MHFAPALVFHFSFFCTPLLFFPYSVNHLPVLDALSCTPHPYSRTLLIIFFTTLILLCSTSPFPVLPFYFFIFRPSCTVLHSFFDFTSPYHALSNSDSGSLQYCSLKQNRGRNFRLSLNCPIIHSVRVLNQFNSRNYRRRPLRNEFGISFGVCLKMCTV